MQYHMFKLGDSILHHERNCILRTPKRFFITPSQAGVTVPSRYFFLTSIMLSLVVTSIAFAGDGKTIAVFGSSVAHGAVDKSGGGYRGRLHTLLKERGWEVLNVSRGGDNTVTIQPRFEEQLIPADPDYVIIGLSLGNEGIRTEEDTDEAREKVFEQFRTGMLGLIRQCRDKGMQPIVVNCYTHAYFNQRQYAITKRMNLLINTWDVPSINVLGALDNGAGQWNNHHEADPWHPNDLGHEEMFRAIVPSLFDAMAAGKGTPHKVEGPGFVRVSGKRADKAPLVFRAGDVVHAHAMSFRVRSKGSGSIAGITGQDGAASIEYARDRITYHATSGGLVAVAMDKGSDWHHVLVSHRYATQDTMLYVDGLLAGSVKEQHAPEAFVLGSAGTRKAPPPPTQADYKDLYVWRSSLNTDEVQAVYEGTLLQSSLEVYAPLRDDAFKKGSVVFNGAQSMSELVVKGKGVIAGSQD
jgi:lysophospholipase L1-like esterase